MKWHGLFSFLTNDFRKLIYKALKWKKKWIRKRNFKYSTISIFNFCSCLFLELILVFFRFYNFFNIGRIYLIRYRIHLYSHIKIPTFYFLMMIVSTLTSTHFFFVCHKLITSQAVLRYVMCLWFLHTQNCFIHSIH